MLSEPVTAAKQNTAVTELTSSRNRPKGISINYMMSSPTTPPVMSLSMRCPGRLRKSTRKMQIAEHLIQIVCYHQQFTPSSWLLGPNAAGRLTKLGVKTLWTFWTMMIKDSYARGECGGVAWFHFGIKLKD